jgi:EpsI family protein
MGAEADIQMKTKVIILTVLLLAAGAFGNYLRFSERRPDKEAAFSAIPLEANGFIGEERRFSDESYEILKADTSTLRYYIGADGGRFWLFIAYFKSQKYGSQIHSPKHCLPGGGWQIQQIEPYHLSLPGGVTKEVNRLIIADRDQKQLMLYWFETRGGAIRNEYGLKFDLMRNSLLLRPTDAAIIRLTLPITRGETIDQATSRAIAYFATFYPSIAASLPFADNSQSGPGQS